MTKVGQIYREKMINRIKEGFGERDNVFLVNYSRLDGSKINDLRKSLRCAGAKMVLSKNSLARRALKDLSHEALVEKVARQTVFVWSDADSSAVSRILVNFAKDLEDVVVQGGVLEGKILGQDDVKRLADLPSREVLLAMLLGTIQAPLTRLAGALNAKTRELLSVLKQLSERSE